MIHIYRHLYVIVTIYQLPKLVVIFHGHFIPQHQFLSSNFLRRSPLAALNDTSSYTFPGLIKTHFPLHLTPSPISAATPIVTTIVGECFIVGVRPSDSCIKVVRGSSLAELFCFCSYRYTVIPLYCITSH